MKYVGLCKISPKQYQLSSGLGPSSQVTVKQLESLKQVKTVRIKKFFVNNSKYSCAIDLKLSDY